MADVESSQRTVAAPPFDEGDVILRSADHIHFYVYSVMLRMASPHFKHFFSLPQPQNSGPQSQPEADNLPVIPVSEDGKTLDLLLRLCYPIKDPVVTTLTEVRDVLTAAIKYELTEATDLMTKRLMEFTANEALQVFAIACRLDLEDQARTAAEMWRCHVIPTHDATMPWTTAVSALTDDMKDISAGSYFRLLEYVRTGQLGTTMCSPPHSMRTPIADDDLVGIYSCEDGDIVLRSIDNKEFPAYKFLLNMVAPSILTSEDDGAAVIQMSLNSAVLAKFLALCLPLADKDMRSLSMAEEIWRAGKKYNIPKMCDIAQEYVKAQIDKDPLSVVFIASRCDCRAEMREALRRCVSMDLVGVYSFEMEDSPAELYYSLLKCNHAYQKAMRATSCSFEQYPNEPPNLDHQWSLGGLQNPNNTHTLPATVFAPIVERSLRYAAKTRYNFKIREIIDLSCELGQSYQELLEKVDLDDELIPVFSHQDDECGSPDSRVGSGAGHPAVYPTTP